MSKGTTTTFQITRWEEQLYNEVANELKMTKTSVTHTYSGELEGEGTIDYLMVNLSEHLVSFVGLERVIGKLGGRSGSFILQHTGKFENGVAHVSFAIIPDSGTGELSGLMGQGGYEAGQAKEHSMMLEYTL